MGSVNKANIEALQTAVLTVLYSINNISWWFVFNVCQYLEVFCTPNYCFTHECFKEVAKTPKHVTQHSQINIGFLCLKGILAALLVTVLGKWKQHCEKDFMFGYLKNFRVYF